MIYAVNSIEIFMPPLRCSIARSKQSPAYPGHREFLYSLRIWRRFYPKAVHLMGFYILSFDNDGNWDKIAEVANAFDDKTEVRNQES